ncbi:uncharacterized protein F4822DRAFT_182777 [Hypoxylon trugodes]|uniref:uncharacterized protein n=1 Tax=Hypoxylon trugodes TaxID=326681 RepID=UPI002193DC5B|nr:uncharacterized protein F4822DRAFT_182777 [Hypoxylon trugodes]KAI1391345.1 hypothetical protein F4822DRAFT_182777 [Hypoxylon trugodes]
MPTPMDLLVPYATSPVYRPTKVVYDAGEGAAVDIFAIHGLGSNAESAWTHKKGNDAEVNWLSDLLPQVEGLQNTRIVLVNHQTRWDSDVAEKGFHDHASELLEHIQDIRKAHPRRPIVFVAHSFGGLLLKKVLLLAKARPTDIASMTKGIIFLGVPHIGSRSAFFGSCLACMAYYRGSSSKLLQLMTIESHSLLDLESEFYDAYVTRYHSEDVQPYICDIFERRPTKVGKLSLGPIVSPGPGQPRHGKLLALDTDHRGLNKFQSHDDPNFHTFLMVLRQAYEYALHRSFPPEKESPPLVKPIPNESIHTNHTIAKQDMLATAGNGLSWIKMSAFAVTCLYGLEELVASWLTRNGEVAGIDFSYVIRLCALWFERDKSLYGNQFIVRVLKLAIYGGLIHVPLRDTLLWILNICFQGHTDMASQVLRLGIINLLIVPFMSIVYISAMAYILGSRDAQSVRSTIRARFWHILVITWLLRFADLYIRYEGSLPIDFWAPCYSVVYFLVSIYINAMIKVAWLSIPHGSERPPGLTTPPKTRSRR